jgi:hypothetical protein
MSSADDDILFAVFKAQLTELQPARGEIVCMTVRSFSDAGTTSSDPKVGRKELVGDPSAELMKRIAAVHAGSRPKSVCTADGAPDDTLGLDNGPVDRTSDTTAKLEGGYSRGRGLLRELAYVVEKKGADWEVTAKKVLRML